MKIIPVPVHCFTKPSCLQGDLLQAGSETLSAKLGGEREVPAHKHLQVVFPSFRFLLKIHLLLFGHRKPVRGVTDIGKFNT